MLYLESTFIANELANDLICVAKSISLGEIKAPITRLHGECSELGNSKSTELF